MSTENVVPFIKKAKENPSLAAEVETLKSRNSEEFVVEMVKLSEREGLPFTAEELKASIKPAEGEELSESALGSVAGGGFFDDVGNFLKNVFTLPSPNDHQWVNRFYGNPK